MASEDQIVKAQYGLEKRRLRTLRAEVPLLDSEAYQKRWRMSKGDAMLDQPISVRRMVFERKALDTPWEYMGTESAL